LIQIGHVLHDLARAKIGVQHWLTAFSFRIDELATHIAWQVPRTELMLEFDEFKGISRATRVNVRVIKSATSSRVSHRRNFSRSRTSSIS
jgi:hypothetical protein